MKRSRLRAIPSDSVRRQFSLYGGFRYAMILLALSAIGGAQLSNSALQQKSEEIQLLLRTGKFDEAEPLVRECIRQRPEEIYFLGQLDMVLNGQRKFGEADELRDRIRKLWEKDYKAEWIAKGSPVGESCVGTSTELFQSTTLSVRSTSFPGSSRDPIAKILWL